MKTIITISLILMSNIIFSQIKINIDNKNAAFTFELLKKKKRIVNDSLLQLQGTKNLIKQISRFDKKANNETYINELKSSIEGTPLAGQNSFQFSQIIKNLDKFQITYNYLINQETNLNNYLNQELSKYLLPEEVLELNVYIILGGTSDGFSDGTTFCIDIGYFKDDIEGMKLLILHEMLHIVQKKIGFDFSYFKENASKFEIDVFDLLSTVLSEGSASFIANPLLIEAPKGYTTWFQRKYNRNLKKTVDSFQLFQSILYRLQNDKNIRFRDLYNIGFSGAWDSPFYFVGFRMFELIRKYEGEGFLSKHLRLSPTKFFLTYNKYAKLENSPGTYPIFNDYIESSIKSINLKLK